MNKEKKVEYPIVELQKIAQIIADATTTNDIKLVVSRQELNLNPELGAKWRMLTDVFLKCTEMAFFRMIEEFLHFLNEDKENEMIEIFDRYGIHIDYDIDGNHYYIIDNKNLPTNQEAEEVMLHAKTQDLAKEDEELVKKIKDARGHHQSYIDVIEQFCKNYKNPTSELNEAFVYLQKLLDTELKEFGISPYHPFRDLYSAENEYAKEPMEVRLDGRPYKIDWNYFRPKLYNIHSQISQLLTDAKTTTKAEAKVKEIK